MVFLYDLGILIYSLFIRIASLKNKKALKWLEGRKNLFSKVANSVNSSEKSIWFHFASLGEFEQGRPVLEQLKKMQPQSKIIITFFSPSGYEIRKNYPLAEHIFYLPVDTKKNAKRFIRLINPEIAVFTKYEYWYHYFQELSKEKIPLFMISAIFRENHIFFKWYGILNRKILSSVSHFFVQNVKSAELLKEIGFNNVTISGDTRFDRVTQNVRDSKKFPEIERFCQSNNVVIAGSTWPADEELLSQLANDNSNWKFIIAPHEIESAKIESLERSFPSTVRYSQLIHLSTLEDPLFNSQTVIVDNIGMLSSLYQYGDIAFIGGGFGAGIHNTLEAAAFGLPVLFGPNYQKFQEAKDLVIKGGGFAVKDYSELRNCFNNLISHKNGEHAGNIAQNYVVSQTGATEKILNEIFHTGHGRRFGNSR